MSLPFVDRIPSDNELERFRLVLSTFQDGSGMLAQKNGRTLPGWRDFERSVAAIFGGINQENKAVFDVLIPDPMIAVTYGISCKMRSELNRLRRDGRVTIELSNSSRKFKDVLTQRNISADNYRSQAKNVGVGIIRLVEAWKQGLRDSNDRPIDLEKSCYLVLLYNKSGFYQLFWFDIHLPDPEKLNWYYPQKINQQGNTIIAEHLNGDDETGGHIFEWYSGRAGN